MKPAVLLGLLRGIDSLARALLERADLDLIALYEPASDLLEREGIPHLTYNSFVTDDLRERALTETAARGQAITEALFSPHMRAQWPHLDNPTWSSFRAETLEVLRRDFVEEILMIDVLQRMVCEVDLRLAVFSEDITRDPKTIIQICQRLGVPSLHIIHGYPYQTQNGHDAVNASVVAVYSEPCKRIFEGFGGRPERIFVTGNPAWDLYASPPRSTVKTRWCEAVGLEPMRPIVTCALTSIHRFSAISARLPFYHLETADRVADAFDTLARAHPDWQFVMRPHPYQHDEVRRLLEGRAADRSVRIQLDSQTAYECVVSTDVLLCTHSNLGIEAILQGKPVVNVALDDVAGPLFAEGLGDLYNEDDAVLWARAQDEIAPAVEAALLDIRTRQRLLEARDKSIAHFNFRNDGGAMQRVCALVSDMMANPGPYADPPTRYPEFERGLAAAVPPAAESVLVIGRASGHVATLLTTRSKPPGVQSGLCIDTSPPGPFDAIVFSDPVPHQTTSVAVLKQATSRLETRGTIVAAFRHGAEESASKDFAQGRFIRGRAEADSPSCVGEHCANSIELIVSRAELEIVEIVEARSFTDAPGGGAGYATGWIVAGTHRQQRPSDIGKERRARQRRSARANARGESIYHQGDVAGAMREFVKAINLWNEDALYHSNLASALYAAGDFEEAWRRLLFALNADPSHTATRENLRTIAAALGKSEEAERLLSLFGNDSRSTDLFV